MASVQELKDNLEALVKQSEALIKQQQNFVDSPPDGLLAALQLGRLDLISVLLTCIGVLLVVFSFVAYYQVNERIKKISTDTSKIVANDTAISEVNKKLPGLVQDILDVMKPSIEGDFNADKIAELADVNHDKEKED